MPKPKTLSGKDIIKILESFNFSVIKQKGSHIKMRREISDIICTIIIPNHIELDKGTIISIYNKASRFIPEKELRDHFFKKQK